MFLGFYTVNFLCFRGNRVNIQAVPNDEATRKSVHEFWTNLQVSFFDAYYIKKTVKLNDFFLRVREKKILSMCQLSKKFTVWKARNVRF